MTQHPSSKGILGLALPAAGSFILGNFYNINDLFFAGRISVDANNAIGLCLMVLIFNAGFVILGSRGALSLVARLTGARQEEAVGHSVYQALWLCLGITVPAGLAGWWIAPHLLEAMGGEGPVLGLATTYLRILYLGLPILALHSLADMVFFGRGNSRVPMQNQALAVTLNLCLNSLVVFVLHWGLYGIALASLLSRALAAARSWWLLRRSGLRIVGKYHPWPEGATIREMLRVGAPTAFSVAMYSGIFMVLNRLLSRFGQEAFGVVGIGIRGIESIGFMVLLGFGAAASSLAGQAIGAGKAAEARSVGWRVLRRALPIAVAFSLLWLLFPRPLIGIYTSDPVLTELCVDYLRIAALANLFQLLEMVPGDTMNGSGVPAPQLAVAISGNLLRLPMAWALVEYTSLGINGVWIAILISAVLKGLAMAGVYQTWDWPGRAAGKLAAFRETQD